ncbi:MAG: AI-2E family transporter [Deinococcales bacterium]
MNLEKQLEQRWVRFCFGLAVAALGLFALQFIFGSFRGIIQELSSVFLLGGLSYLFAYLFHPLVVWLQKYRVRRELGLVVAFVIVLLFLALSTLLIGTVVQELALFAKKLPALVTSVQTQINTWIDELEQVRGQNQQIRDLIDQGTKALQEALSRIVQNVLGLLQSTSTGLVTRTLGVLGGVVQFFLILIVGTYMLGAFESIGKTMLGLVPVRFQGRVLEFSQDISVAIGGYIRGQLLIAAAVGTMVGVGLAVLGVPLALALGFISAIFNIMPYLGVIISIVPALLLASQFGVVTMILVVLVFVIANQVEALVLSPNILGRTTELHPITIILTIIAGASILGVFGGLLAVPLVALAKLLVYKHWIGSKWHSGTLEPVLNSKVAEDASANPETTN